MSSWDNDPIINAAAPVQSPSGAPQAPAPSAASPTSSASPWDNDPLVSPPQPAPNAQAQPAQEATAQMSPLRSIVRMANDGLTLGFGDEISSSLGAALNPVFGTGNDGDTFGERFDKNMTGEKALNQQAKEQNPISAAFGSAVGAVAPALLTMGSSLAPTAGRALAVEAAPALAETAARSAATGAAYGGVYGLGSAEGDLSDRLPAAVRGAEIGAALGGVIPLGAAGAGRVIERAAPSPAPIPATASAPFVTTENDAGRTIVAAVNAPKRGQDEALGDLAALVQPQQTVIDAAGRLGVGGLTPAQISGNQAYRNVEGALSAIPGSALNEQKRASYLQLAQKADDFINDFGGNTDKAAYSDEFKRSATATINGLSGQADDLYRYIRTEIPNTTQAPADNTIGYIQGKIADLGGAPLLNANEKRALAVLTPKTSVEPAGALFPGQVVNSTQYPTYAALDMVRKQVGQGYSRTGPFKDMQSGQLDALYGALSRDQEALVNSVSPELGAVYQGAKSLVAQRKGVEEGLQSVLGKDLSGSIATSLGSSVKQLAQGNFKNFDNIIQHIPENSRQDAIVTALNDAFTNKSGAEQQLSASGFVNWYGDLNRNNAARARLTKYLPDEATKRLDDIYTVAKGMKDASAEVVKTGVSLGVLKDYAAQGGMLSRIWDIAKPAAAAEGVTTTLGIPGVGAASVIASALSKQKTPIQESASNLLASDKFQNMVKAYAASGGKLQANVLAREKQLARTQVYRQWSQALSEPSKARLAAVGPLTYLTEKSSSE